MFNEDNEEKESIVQKPAHFKISEFINFLVVPNDFAFILRTAVITRTNRVEIIKKSEEGDRMPIL